MINENRHASYLPTAGVVDDPQLLGMYVAQVAVTSDPLNQGRVRLIVPQVLGTAQSNWALPLNEGIVPATGTLCYAFFLGGNINTPFYFVGMSQALVQAIGNSSAVLNANPYFIGGLLTGWTASNGTLTALNPNPSTNPPFPYAALWTGSGSGGGYIQETALPFTAVVGQPYQIQAWVYYAAGGSVNVGFGWTGHPDTVTAVTVPAGTWTLLTQVNTATATTGYPKVGPVSSSSGTQFMATAIAVTGQVPGQIISAGSISSGQVNFSARQIGGITTSIQTTAPVGAKAGDLWFDSSNNYKLNQFDGTSWNPYQFGTNAFAAGSVTAAIIAANTITAAQLAAGIIYAGIVNGTLIEGATLMADGTTGQLLIYQGPAASGNLIGAWSGTAGSDAQTPANPFIAGLQIGLAGTGQILGMPSVNQPFNLTTSVNGVFNAMMQHTVNDVNMMMPEMFGSVLLGSGTATKMSGVWHSPFGTQGAAIVMQAQNDAGTDTPVITMGTVTMPDGMTMVFTPIMTLTPYALVLYSGSSTQVIVTKTTGSGTIPIPAGVTTAKGECWGGGGGSGAAITASPNYGGSGGGGGEYAMEPSLAVTSGGTVSYTVGTGGSGAVVTGSSIGGNGNASTLTGTTVTVTANGGGGGISDGGTPGAGGSGSTNTTHFSGGGGGIDNDPNQGGGGGGGGSGGTSSAGRVGGNTNTTTGGSGGIAVIGGGAGGKGGNGNTGGTGAAGSTGSAPGGGAGGAGGGTAGRAGTAGANGQVRLTYITGMPSVGFSINFGAAFTDQFGNTIPVGMHLTIGTTPGDIHTDTAGGLVVKPDLELDPPASAPSTPGGGVKLYAEPATGTVTGVTLLTNSGMSGQLPSTQTDIPASPTTVTQSTFTNLTKQYSIPANDAQVGTVYRLTCWGDLTTPASALQACRWAMVAFGIAAGSLAWCSIAAAALTASTNYEWYLTATLNVVAIGASGTINTWESGSISVFEGTLVSPVNLTSSNSFALTGAAGNTTVNTTAATTFGIQSEWANVETGQQVRYFGSTLERMGP